MDLLSLPEEMLANVFRYSKFETVTRLRCLSKQIDRATVRYGVNNVKLNKQKIHIVRFNGRNNNLEAQYRRFDILESQKENHPAQLSKSLYPENERGDSFGGMDTFLRKIRCNVIEVSMALVDDKLLNMLKKYKDEEKRVRVAAIRIHWCNLAVSLEDLNSLLIKFKTKKEIINDESTTLSGRYTTDEVLCSLLSVSCKLEMTSVFNEKRPFPDITDKTLRAACCSMPRQIFFMGMMCSFTIEMVLKGLKKVMESDVKPMFSWYLGYVKVNSSEELNRVVANLSKHAEIRITEEDYDSTGICWTKLIPPPLVWRIFQFNMFCEEDAVEM